MRRSAGKAAIEAWVSVPFSTETRLRFQKPLLLATELLRPSNHAGRCAINPSPSFASITLGIAAARSCPGLNGTAACPLLRGSSARGPGIPTARSRLWPTPCCPSSGAPRRSCTSRPSAWRGALGGLRDELAVPGQGRPPRLGREGRPRRGPEDRGDAVRPQGLFARRPAPIHPVHG